ncbi:AAA family ATPase [Hugenholtzia roseola]|uniref:AAA family ATPase n=1 Tax=Hugenholtzia roseola TaxID=1002 RepID=UPI00040C470D|nr:AAA family ATPase [Hugenholtzia roseola]
MIFRNKKNTEKPYKFKDLRTYASTEWLADGQKKYRSVYEAMETSFIYAELTFHNKLFDYEEWQANIELRCYHIKEKEGRVLICNIDVKQTIAPEADTVYVREGWGGAEAGSFWKKGDYIWEAYIEGELVGSRFFYVEAAGSVTEDFNPYFEIDSIRLYEGSNQGKPVGERVYYTHFHHVDTRYIWVEFNFNNHHDDDWFCELTFNFYNEARQLKGKTIELRRILKDEASISFSTGWGSDARASWFKGFYTVEIVFMDKLIATLPFEVATKYFIGTNPYYEQNLFKERLTHSTPQTEDDFTLEDSLQELNRLVGLREIKRKIQDYTYYMNFTKLRKERGFEEKKPLNLHAVFKGNPGTGKTTVAHLLGRIYKKMGFLSDGKVYEVGRVELVGQYIGQTAPKVKEVIEKARGGVLFIDEAYALIRNNDDSKDYGHEVLEILVKEMSDGEGNLVIVMAGYTAQMEVLLESNPGLKSRIGLSLEFDDYSPQELLKIAYLAAEDYELTLTDEAFHVFAKKLTETFRKRDKTFGNGRLVYMMMEKAKINMAIRLMVEGNAENLDKESLRLVQVADILKLEEGRKPRQVEEIDTDEEALQEALEELNGLIGLKEVKLRVRELVDLVRFYKQTGRNITHQFSLHSIFKGNPGTGKTTVARLLAQIYKALGILERGHLIETDRQGLVAGYVGQTAIKTRERIEEAMGGVLFVDEAYALHSANSYHDFGHEAVETLLKKMEDRRGDFIVIAAGYPRNMDDFLNMNPGLKSRFDRIFHFEDFTTEELLEIALAAFGKENLKLEPAAQAFLEAEIRELHRKRDLYFGNARTIRKMVREAIRQQHLRIAQISAEARTPYLLQTILLEDLKAVPQSEKEEQRRSSVGF